MPSARLVLAALLPLTLSVFSAACSSSQPPAEAPPAPRQDQTAYGQAGYPQPPAASAAPTATSAPGMAGGLWANLPPPADLPSALTQLDAAEQAILIATGAAPGDAQATSPAAKRPESSGVMLGQDQACSIACSALASMKRSADHVCTMAGDKDAACGTARERVQRAESRVTAACPACPK